MKRFLFVLCTVLFLALLVVPSTPASADSSLTRGCTSSPSSGPIGTVFAVTCFGFNSEEMVTAWATEPDGMVWTMPGGKVGKDGSITYVLPSRVYGGTAAISVGQWAFTVKGATSGLTMIGRFTVTGGKEGVSGATLLADKDGNVFGTGFLPNETVSVWIDFPNGDCSNTWFGPFLGQTIGLSTLSVGEIKANSAGDILFQFGVGSLWCQGTYHIVARGMTSGIGGETWWSTPNRPVGGGALLVASPSTAFITNGFVTFAGTLFGANESVSCWLTNPQGRVTFLGDFKTDATGSFAFGYPTGVFWVSPPLGPYGEGPVGEYATTCKGATSGLTGIARFTLTGHTVVDP